jgi:hypothetical protein
MSRATAPAVSQEASAEAEGLSSPASKKIDDGLVFRVCVHEGVGFGPQLSALLCQVALGQSTRHTPFSVQRDRHTWDTTLVWSLTKQQWRRLSSTGQFVCKVSVLERESGGRPAPSSPRPDSLQGLTRLGWIVLDLRRAKLNLQYDKAQGARLAH